MIMKKTSVKLTKKSVKDYKKIVDTLYKELERRDKLIDELNERNNLLMKTALKAQEKARRFQDVAEKSTSSQSKSTSQ